MNLLQVSTSPISTNNILLYLYRTIMAPLVAQERLLPFVILSFISIYPLGFHNSHNAEDFLRKVDNSPTGVHKMSKPVVDHEVILICGLHRLLALFRTLSHSSNTILFMGWWPLFQKRCLFLARRHEYGTPLDCPRARTRNQPKPPLSNNRQVNQQPAWNYFVLSIFYTVILIHYGE